MPKEKVHIADVAERFYIDYLSHKEINEVSDVFISPLQAYEYNYSDDNSAPKTLSSKLVRWVTNSPKPIIASRSRIIAYAFANKLTSVQTNSIIQSYGFASLYERSFVDSTIIYSLDTQMTVTDWGRLYRSFLNDFIEISKDKVPETKFGSKDLSRRDFYKYLVEIGSLPENFDNETEQMAVEIYEVAHRNLKNKNLSCVRFLDRQTEIIYEIHKNINGFFFSNLAIYASLDNIPSIIQKESGEKDSFITRTDVYRIIANHLSPLSDNDIHSLYIRLNKNASSLLDEATLKHFFSSTDNLELIYQNIHPYFSTNFSLQQLWEMMAKSSEMDDKNNLVTLNFTSKSIKPELQDAIKRHDYAGFFYKYAEEMANTRSKKRRYIIKYLHSMMRDRYLAFLSFQDEILSKKKIKLRDEYLALAKNTLIYGLSSECGLASKKTDNETKDDPSPYSINKITQNNKLTMDLLQDRPVVMAHVFYDFSKFCGYQNNIDKRFIQNYNVMIYYEQNGLFDVGYATISLSLAKNTSLTLEYDREHFVYQYQLTDASEQTINELFYNEFSKCIRGFDELTAEKLKWLLQKSSEQFYEDEFEKYAAEESPKIINSAEALLDKPKEKDNRYNVVYEMFTDILDGSIDASREFLLLFSVYCGVSKKEILDHLLPNVGYSTLLPKRRIFDRLISDLCKFDSSEERSLTLNLILEHLESSAEEEVLGDDEEYITDDTPTDRIFGLHKIIYDTIVGEEIVNKK